MKTFLALTAALCSLSITSPLLAEETYTPTEAEDAAYHLGFDAGVMASACQLYVAGDITAAAYRKQVNYVLNANKSDPQAFVQVMAANGPVMQPCLDDFQSALNQ